MEGVRQTPPPSRTDPRASEERPVYSLQDLRRDFDALYLDLWRMAGWHFEHLDADAAEEATAKTVAFAWRGVKLWYDTTPKEFAPDNAVERIRQCLRHAVRQTHQSRRFLGDKQSRGKERADVFDAELKPYTAGWNVRVFISRSTPVPDQVGFSLDFEAFVSALSPHDRVILGCFIAGESTGEIAVKLGVTPGRVSQHRTRLLAKIREFFHD
ncbi:MAG: hypothetical protein Q9211_007144 [Gyalolechia sp. 1 TL-2023]